MNTDNHIKIKLFDEDITLKYGLRSSKRMREIFPDTTKIGELGAEDVLVLSIKCGLPAHLHNISDDELIDEIDNSDPAEINKAFLAFNRTNNFFNTAIMGPKSTEKESQSVEAER